MKKTIFAAVFAAIAIFSAGCTEAGKEYLGKTSAKLQEIYQTFDIDEFIQTIKDNISNVVDAGKVIVGDISQMTNEELSGKIKELLFGSEDASGGSIIGFDISVEKVEEEDGNLTASTTFNIKIGTITLEKKVSITFEPSGDDWAIKDFSIE